MIFTKKLKLRLKIVNKCQDLHIREIGVDGKWVSVKGEDVGKVFKELYRGDLERYKNHQIDRWTKEYLFFLRKVQTCNNKYINILYRFMYRRLSQKHGIEIPRGTTIGKGLYIGHPYNITINENAVIGKNVNIHKGVTIGQENRGKRKGAPFIGDSVWIGIGAVIVGKISIGEDVLIAPNSFVNCDVPDHSVVFGNPCKVVAKENATEGYLCHLV